MKPVIAIRHQHVRFITSNINYHVIITAVVHRNVFEAAMDDCSCSDMAIDNAGDESDTGETFIEVRLLLLLACCPSMLKIICVE